MPAEFDPKKKLEIHPEYIIKYFIEEASLMLYELKYNKNKINVLPSQSTNSGYKRVQVSSNPEWYSKIWWEYKYTVKQRKNKPSTARYGIRLVRSNIKRSRVIASLQRITKREDLEYKCYPNGYRVGVYDTIMRGIIFNRLVEPVDINVGSIPPNPDIIKYFFGHNQEDLASAESHLENIISDETNRGVPLEILEDIGY